MKDDARMIEQAFAGRRQFDAAAAAPQQRNAKRFFQSLDPLARRGQREMNAACAVGDAPRLRHRDEELKINQIESHRDSPRGSRSRSRHCEPPDRRDAPPRWLAMTGNLQPSIYPKAVSVI